MTYELREHTADVAVAASADSLGGVFAACADGMAAAMTEETRQTGERFSLTERAGSREALLFDYLDRLIYERDVRGVLPVANEAVVRRDGDEWVVEASARGVPLADVHARDLKAVTYSEMELSQGEHVHGRDANGDSPEEGSDGGWYAYVVFDV